MSIDADFEHDDPDSPELTEALVATMRPASEVLDAALYGALIAQDVSRFRYVILKDKPGEYRWVLSGPGGQVLAQSPQAYSAAADARAAIQVVQRAAAAKPGVEAA